MLSIRKEQSNDYQIIDELIKEAFATAEYIDGNEQNLVAALRKGSSFIPELSLVAEIDGTIAGHILFTKAKVGVNEVLALAPLSVKPDYQNQGVGTALVNKGHEIARKLGYSYVIVLGHETYYSRFGYQPAEQMGVLVPDGIPSKNFMAIKLQRNAESLHGTMLYAEEFGM